MCVGSVCAHPPYNDKNPPAPFFNPQKSKSVSQKEPFAESVKCDVMFYRPRPRLLTNTAVLAETRLFRCVRSENRISEV